VRRVLLVFSLLLCSAAMADEPKVLVFVNTRAGAAGFQTGSVVHPGDYTSELLYMTQTCRLPIVGAKDMLRYYNSAMGRAGCWAPTIDGCFDVVLSDGHEFHSQILWHMYARGRLNADGATVTIIEPNFDSATFASEQMTKAALGSMKRDSE
jgi:hypothetical protein